MRTHVMRQYTIAAAAYVVVGVAGAGVALLGTGAPPQYSQPVFYYAPDCPGCGDVLPSVRQLAGLRYVDISQGEGYRQAVAAQGGPEVNVPYLEAVVAGSRRSASGSGDVSALAHALSAPDREREVLFKVGVALLGIVLVACAAPWLWLGELAPPAGVLLSLLAAMRPCTACVRRGIAC
ncbi:MAG: hypothetical protein HRF45_03240 [Fimbriimonadia bacterium]